MKKTIMLLNTIILVACFGLTSCNPAESGSSNGSNSKTTTTGVEISNKSSQLAQKIVGLQFCSEVSYVNEETKKEEIFKSKIILNADASFERSNSVVGDEKNAEKISGEWGATETTLTFKWDKGLITLKAKITDNNLNLVETHEGKEFSYDYSLCNGGALNQVESDTNSSSEDNVPTSESGNSSVQFEILDKKYCANEVEVSENGIEFIDSVIFNSNGVMTIEIIDADTQSILEVINGTWKHFSENGMELTIKGEKNSIRYSVLEKNMSLLHFGDEGMKVDYYTECSN